MFSRYHTLFHRIPLRLFTLVYIRQTSIRHAYSIQKKAKHTAQTNITTTTTSQPIQRVALPKDYDTLVQRLDHALAGNNTDYLLVQCQLLEKHHHFLSKLPTEKVGEIFDKFATLDPTLLPDFIKLVFDSGVKLQTQEQYMHLLKYALETGGTTAVRKVYNRFRSIILTEENIPLLRFIHDTVTSAKYSCSIRAPQKLLYDLFEEETTKPWLKQFYPTLLFTLVIRKSKNRLPIYKKIRERIDTMDRMLYINLFGWITVRNRKELELAELLFEDFMRQNYVFTKHTYIRFCHELLRGKYDTPNVYEGISSHQRADFLYRIFQYHATFNIFPVPYLVSLLIRLLTSVHRYQDAQHVYQLYVKQNSRTLNIDAAYVRVLLEQDKLEEADTFYHDMFHHGLHQLDDGTFKGIHDEWIEYCSRRTVGLIDPAHVQHKNPLSVVEQEKDTPEEEEEKDIARILDQPYVEFVGKSNELKRSMQKIISCSVVVYATEPLILAHLKTYQNLAFYKVYERFEEIGLYDIMVYTHTLEGLKLAQQYELMDKVFENIKKRHLMLTCTVTALYMERYLVKGDLETAEQALHEYLRIREHVRAYEKNDKSMANPGYLFMILIAKYTALNMMECVQKLVDLGLNVSFIEHYFITLGELEGMMARDPSAFIQWIETLDGKPRVHHDAVYTRIINHLIKIDQRELAEQWYQRGCAAGFRMEDCILNASLSDEQSQGSLDSIEE